MTNALPALTSWRVFLWINIIHTLKNFQKKISKKILKKILKFSTKHFTNLHVKKISFWGGLNNFLPKKLDFGPQNPFFISKKFLCAIFLKSCYPLTPIILCHLVNKISISELNEEIFYKQPVFTRRSFYSKTSTFLGAQCSKFVKMLHLHQNQNGAK